MVEDEASLASKFVVALILLVSHDLAQWRHILRKCFDYSGLGSSCDADLFAFPHQLSTTPGAADFVIERLSLPEDCFSSASQQWGISI